MNDLKSITLKDGTEIKYMQYFTAGLYLDLQNIPSGLAGERLRTVAKSLIVSVAENKSKEFISQFVEKMNLTDFGILAEALTSVMQNEAKAEVKKKDNGDIPESDAGNIHADIENGGGRGTA